MYIGLNTTTLRKKEFFNKVYTNYGTLGVVLYGNVAVITLLMFDGI